MSAVTLTPQRSIFMAKETKFIKVSPSSVNSTMEKWADFGWEIVGAPWEIFNKTTHRTQETDKHYSSEYTETVNYVKITFQRDTSMPNYKELVELENQYDAPLPPAPSAFLKAEPKKMGCLWIVLAFVGIFATLGIGTILIIVLRLTSYKKRVAKWEEEKAQFEKNNAPVIAAYEEAKKNRAETRKKAKSLV